MGKIKNVIKEVRRSKPTGQVPDIHIGGLRCEIALYLEMT
jgi:hypothetical protein